MDDAAPTTVRPPPVIGGWHWWTGRPTVDLDVAGPPGPLFATLADALVGQGFRLQPAFSGYRQYAPALLSTARRIRELRDIGLGVAELAACAPRLDDPTVMRSVLERQRSRLALDETAVADRLRGVDHLIAELGPGR